MRSRPKILFARTLEQAKDIYSEYKDYLLCVITDLELGNDMNAGLSLIDVLQKESSFVPILAQSSDAELLRKAREKGVEVSNKNTPFVLNDFHNFLLKKCGFGDFIFQEENGNEIETAKTMAEFENTLATIPISSFEFHQKHKHFCTWLIARGELSLAKKLRKTD